MLWGEFDPCSQRLQDLSEKTSFLPVGVPCKDQLSLISTLDNNSKPTCSKDGMQVQYVSQP
jgi:hypothetical protein